jgi:four helix bundle protein
MTKDELQNRTKVFALNILHYTNGFSNKGEGSRVLSKQLIRSATSVAANYRAACKARSKADFISKITVVEEEADESYLWIELIMKSGICNSLQSKELLKEAYELTAIFTAAGKTAKKNNGK